MPYPAVMPLPPAASRVGDPDNFPAESDLFLANLAPWRTESNALASYINAAPLNIWNWGFIDDINPTISILPLVSSRPSVGGVLWATTQDALWASLEAVSYAQDAVGQFVDDIGALTGSATDPDRLNASLMATAPARGQPQLTFNATSQSFYDSTAIYAENLNTVAYYFEMAISPEDFGLVTTPSTVTTDWGTL